MSKSQKPFPSPDYVRTDHIIDADGLTPRSARAVGRYADDAGMRVLCKQIATRAIAAEAASVLESHMLITEAMDEAIEQHPEEEDFFRIIKNAAFRRNLDLLLGR